MKDSDPTASMHLPTGTGDIEAMAMTMEPDDEELETASVYPGRYRLSNSYDLESMTSTRSLYEKDMNYVIENGRRYAGQYFAPNDEIE